MKLFPLEDEMVKKQFQIILIFCIAVVLSGFAASASATVLSCVTPPPGMVSWWPGDGSTADIAGGNTGTLHSNVTYVAGEVNQAFSFDGSSGSITANIASTAIDNITMDAWVKWGGPNPSNSNQVIFYNGNTSSSGYGLFLDSDGTLCVLLGGEVFKGSTTNLTQGEWQHVAVVRDNGLWSLYLNGNLLSFAGGGTTFSSGPGTPWGNILIGGNDSGTREVFKGQIDEAEFFNRALSAAEIQGIYNAGSAGKCRSASITIPSATGDITLTTDTAGCFFSNAEAMTKDQVPVNDPSYNYPYGLVKFSLSCSVPGASANVSITFPGSVEGTTYRKYGPFTPGDYSTEKWYTFSHVTTNNNTVTLHLTDGQLGDDTGEDAVIVDQGGAGNGAVSTPTMNEWGMIIFMALAGLGATYFLRRRRSAGSGK